MKWMREETEARPGKRKEERRGEPQWMRKDGRRRKQKKKDA